MLNSDNQIMIQIIAKQAQLIMKFYNRDGLSQLINIVNLLKFHINE